MTARPAGVTAAPVQIAGANDARVDFLLIADMIEDGARVLDVGCSDGSLLQLLTERRNVDGRGIELSQSGVNTCVARGLSVIQGDADTDLVHYPDAAFDYVILSQTIQATRNPRLVVEEMLRIGKRAIVSFPNFGYWKIRLHLLARGRMPVTASLPACWYDTPNIHFCTIKDFVSLCDDIDAAIEQQIALNAHGRRVSFGGGSAAANLFAELAVFLLAR